MINLSPVVRHIEADQWSIRLRADGLGEAKVPADFNPDHVKAVRGALGDGFDLIDPSEYRRREGRWVFLGIAPNVLTVSHTSAL